MITGTVPPGLVFLFFCLLWLSFFFFFFLLFFSTPSWPGRKAGWACLCWAHHPSSGLFILGPPPSYALPWRPPRSPKQQEPGAAQKNDANTKPHRPKRGGRPPANTNLSQNGASAPVAPATQDLVEPALQPAAGPHTWTAARPPPLQRAKCLRSTVGFSCRSFLPAEAFCSKMQNANGRLIPFSPSVGRLRRSPPVPLSRFLSVLEALQDVAALDGRRVPAAEALLVPSLREAGTALPTHTLVHFRWVLERCLTPHSYVPAAQEALLQVFLSERVASGLSVLADRLRSGAQPAPPVVPLQPAALPVPDQPLPAPERDPSPALVAPPAPRPLAASQPARLPPLGFPEEDVGFGTPVPVAQPPAGPPPLRFPEEDVCLATPVPVAQPLADGAPPAPSSPAHSAGRPDGGARFEADSDTAPPAGLPRMPDLDSPPIRSAPARLDQVDLQALLQQRCLFFQCPPKFFRRPFRAALSLALRAIDVARPEDAPAQVRAWTLWLLLPRLLLHRPPGTHRLTKPKWRSRLLDFQAGRWELLLQSAARCIPATEGDAQPPVSPPEQNRRAERAARLVSQGELSAASSALVAGPLAPMSEHTLAELRDRARRPAQTYEPLDPALLDSSLRPLSRSPPTRSLQTCAVPVKEQQRAPVATPRSCAALFWMTKHLVLLSSEQPLISHRRRFPLASSPPLALAASWRCRNQMAVSGA